MVGAMNSKLTLLLVTAVALNACAEPDSPSASEVEPKLAAAEQPRIKDQVLKILCDSGQRNVQQELIPVVRYARQRDGKSDRVWEVADEADCTEQEDSEQA